MYTKKNTRLSYRSNRRSGYKRSNSYSNSKTKNKGNLSQQYNKFLKLAKEASSTGDRIQTEYYYQFTDHYSRLMIDLEIPFLDEDNKEVTTEHWCGIYSMKMEFNYTNSPIYINEIHVKNQFNVLMQKFEM